MSALMHLMIVISRLTILRISNHFQRKIVLSAKLYFERAI